MRMKTTEIVSFFIRLKKEITLGVIIAVLVSIVIFIIGECRHSKREEEKKPPILIVVNPILAVKEKIIIKAGNDRADRKGKESLHVKFDGHIFENAAAPLPKAKAKRQRWEFDLKRYPLTPRMRKEGEHRICFAFKDEDFSKEQSITLLPGEDDSNGSVIFLILLVIIIVAAVGCGIYVFIEKSRKPKVPEIEEENNEYFK
jgi:hypothetical protein